LLTGVAWLLFVRVAPGGKVSGEALRAPLGSERLVSSGAAPVAATPAQSGTALPRADGVVASLPGLQAAPRARFAEIRIRRPAKVSGNVPFVWWTEGASAKPGIDFVNQSKVIQSFPAGKNSTSVFVKLLPRPSGMSSGVFYIAVAERGDQNLKHVTHTAVRLPEDAL
jgi:hypothetical protein